MQWSGVAFGATFFSAALVAPLWGRLADLYGRKLMLIRASLGMAVAMSLIGLAENVWQLVALRLLAGFLGGYASGSTVLVATQTPKARSAWALGTSARSGIMAETSSGRSSADAAAADRIRATFLAAGAVIFLAFLATLFLIREAPRPPKSAREGGGFSSIPDKRPALAMLATGMLLMLAVMSVEPIITVYVAELTRDPARSPWSPGSPCRRPPLGSILSAPRCGGSPTGSAPGPSSPGA